MEQIHSMEQVHSLEQGRRMLGGRRPLFGLCFPSCRGRNLGGLDCEGVRRPE